MVPRDEPENRQALIERLRQAIREDRYETSEKLEAAIESFLDHQAKAARRS